MSCAAEILIGVYPPHDNTVQLVLYNNGVVLSDLSSLTRATVDLGGGTTVIDSATAASGTLTWTDTVQHRGQAVDVLTLKLGGAGINEGVYEGVEVVVYSATYPNGLRIENPIKITVHA